MASDYESNISDDLSKRSIPDFSTDSPDFSVLIAQVFRWVEGEALLTYKWYMKEKQRKKLASKILRVVAILMLTAGAAFPSVALLTDRAIRPEWGYIALACGGGAVFLDRGFGFSSSWMRYTATGLALGTSITRYQMQWTVWRMEHAEPTREICVQFLNSVIKPFIVEVNEAVEQETGQWSSLIGEHLDELSSSLPVASSQPHN